MALAAATHLNFPGTARDALHFYQEVFGGDLTLATYEQFGMPAHVPGADKVVFGSLATADGFKLLAYDIPGREEPFSGFVTRDQGTTVTDRPFFVSIQGDTLDEVERYWAGLSEGATIVEPLAASAWSAGFGMLTDSYGVTWVLDVRNQ